MIENNHENAAYIISILPSVHFFCKIKDARNVYLHHRRFPWDDKNGAAIPWLFSIISQPYPTVQSNTAIIIQNLDLELDVLHRNKPMVLMTDNMRIPSFVYHRLIPYEMMTKKFYW